MKRRTLALILVALLSGLVGVASAQQGPVAALANANRAIGTATSSPIYPPPGGARGYYLSGGTTGQGANKASISVQLLSVDRATGVLVAPPAAETLIVTASNGGASNLTVYPGITAAANRAVNNAYNANGAESYVLRAIVSGSSELCGFSVGWIQ